MGNGQSNVQFKKKMEETKWVKDPSSCDKKCQITSILDVLGCKIQAGDVSVENLILELNDKPIDLRNVFITVCFMHIVGTNYSCDTFRHEIVTYNSTPDALKILTTVEGFVPARASDDLLTFSNAMLHHVFNMKFRVRTTDINEATRLKIYSPGDLSCAVCIYRLRGSYPRKAFVIDTSKYLQTVVSMDAKAVPTCIEFYFKAMYLLASWVSDKETFKLVEVAAAAVGDAQPTRFQDIPSDAIKNSMLQSSAMSYVTTCKGTIQPHVVYTQFVKLVKDVARINKDTAYFEGLDDAIPLYIKSLTTIQKVAGNLPLLLYLTCVAKVQGRDMLPHEFQYWNKVVSPDVLQKFVDANAKAVYAVADWIGSNKPELPNAYGKTTSYDITKDIKFGQISKDDHIRHAMESSQVGLYYTGEEAVDPSSLYAVLHWLLHNIGLVHRRIAYTKTLAGKNEAVATFGLNYYSIRHQTIRTNQDNIPMTLAFCISKVNFRFLGGSLLAYIENEMIIPTAEIIKKSSKGALIVNTIYLITTWMGNESNFPDFDDYAWFNSSANLYALDNDLGRENYNVVMQFMKQINAVWAKFVEQPRNPPKRSVDQGILPIYRFIEALSKL